MKKITVFLAVSLLLLLHVGRPFAQTSDYEIIESFKKAHQSLLESIKTVQDPGQSEVLQSEIGRLESDYGQHGKLLGEGLYPESYETAIATLRDGLKKSNERLLLAEESRKDKARIEDDSRKIQEHEKKIEVISTQNEGYRVKVDKLSRDVEDLSARVQHLSDENAGLQGKIKALQLEGRKDKKTIAELNALTEKLNANIRDRDELIVKLMNSLFDEYAKADLTDVQKKNLLAIPQANDYVGKIVATIDGNISYVKAAILTPQDVKLIRNQQRILSTKWEELKPSVSKLYPDEQTRARDITLVDGRLSDMKKSLDDATWRSINQVFVVNSVAVAPFRNAGELHQNLLAYLDEQLKNPSRDKYQAFKHKVWDSPIKDQWLPLVPLEELTQKQRSDIEEKIVLLDKRISAIFWRWVLIGAVVAALLAAGAVLVRRKKQPPLQA